MIVDTSAIMAILLDESDAEHLIDVLFENPLRKVSAGTWIELSAVITRHQDAVISESFDMLMRKLRIEIVAMSVKQAEIDHDAYRKFGRGVKHPARLNFGDCFAYALSIESGEPLLFKGDDFGHTDIVPAS